MKKHKGCPCGCCEAYELLGLDACMGCAGKKREPETITECVEYPASLLDADSGIYEQ